MFGNTLALTIATVSAVPVETSCWICLVAFRYTQLPEAPPTESSASTSGTPAANMVEQVRVQRATVAFRISSPNTGTLSARRSMKICTASDFFQSARKPYTPPPAMPKMRYQYATKNSEIASTISVGAGRSAPKFANTVLNAGITKIMMTAVITNATTMIATG